MEDLMSDESQKIRIEYVDPRTLKVPSWRATHILRPDLLIISGMLFEYGFIQPIHVRAETKEIIDGSERFLLASALPEILDRTDGMIPVIFHDVSLMEAMMMHVRLNRGKSNLIAMRVSEIIKTVKRSGSYSIDEMRSLLSMGNDELMLMLDGSLLKTRKIKEHNYARAWVPIEAPSAKRDSNPMTFEKPPNPDR
jgi:hypothetical protein